MAFEGKPPSSGRSENRGCWHRGAVCRRAGLLLAGRCESGWGHWRGVETAVGGGQALSICGPGEASLADSALPAPLSLCTCHKAAVPSLSPLYGCGKAVCPRAFKGTAGTGGGLDGEAWLWPWEVRQPPFRPVAVQALTHALSPQTIMEQFNPSLRNFIAMGKNYEKALAGKAAAGGGWACPGPDWSVALGQARKVCLGARGRGSDEGVPPPRLLRPLEVRRFPSGPPAPAGPEAPRGLFPGLAQSRAPPARAHRHLGRRRLPVLRSPASRSS